jgi:hypothetical protein
MSLLYKPDWEEAKERYEAWWAHEAIGRCAMSVTAPRSGVTAQDPPAFPEKLEDRWLDFGYVGAINDYHMSRTFYGGEAVPVWCPGYPGWAWIPVFLGCSVELRETTGWNDPIISHGSLTDHDFNDLVIDPENRWWKLAQDMLRFSVSAAKGKSIPGVGAFGGCGDTLACIRGTDNLLLDVMDCPEYVRDFELYLMKQWAEVFDTFYDIVRETAQGSTCWFSLWSPGKFYAAHNDFSYMISPKLFRDVFLPAIEMQTNFLDHAVYHVDGIGAFAHVDALCELPRLQAFQILPGAGKPSPLHYMDVLKKVQSAGKNLHISIPPEEVEPALSELSARGLFIDTWCDTEEEARELLRSAETWSSDRQPWRKVLGVG